MNFFTGCPIPHQLHSRWDLSADLVPMVLPWQPQQPQQTICSASFCPLLEDMQKHLMKDYWTGVEYLIPIGGIHLEKTLHLLWHLASLTEVPIPFHLLPGYSGTL